MLVITPASVCYFSCILSVKGIKFFEIFVSYLVLKNIRQGYSAQTANTICGLRNFGIEVTFMYFVDSVR